MNCISANDYVEKIKKRRIYFPSHGSKFREKNMAFFFFYFDETSAADRRWIVIDEIPPSTSVRRPGVHLECSWERRLQVSAALTANFRQPLFHKSLRRPARTARAEAIYIYRYRYIRSVQFHAVRATASLFKFDVMLSCITFRRFSKNPPRLASE